MFAQYSPLFTSGLLSESNTPSSSRRPSLDVRQKEPRGSLPVDVNIDGIYETSSYDDDAVLLTFMPRRRRVEAGNSFLSLDLAESQSMRSMSLRRKDTVTTRATTHFGRSVPASPTSPPMPFASFSTFGAVLPRKSLVRHSSREGLPGVKPVPSSNLPDLPTRRPRPADLTITLSACLSQFSPGASTSFHRSVHSEPSIISPISPLLSPIERSYFMFSPPTSPLATSTSYPWSDDAPHSAPAAAPLRSRPSVRSTASYRTRQVNRSAALAALEGRVGRKQRPRSRPNNFMSMSDDEDDGDDDESLVTPVAVSAPASAIPVQPVLLDVLHEEEDVVVPTPAPLGRKRLASAPSSASGSRKTRSRRGTLENLLTPLTNFIDFRDDDGSTRSWRSFVEIS